MDLEGNNPISVGTTSSATSTTISSHGGGLSFSLLSMNPTSRRSIRKRKRRRCFKDDAFLPLHGSSSPDQRLNHHQYSSTTTSYTSVMARVPLPGPTWSTTAPSVVAVDGVNSPSMVAPLVVEEFEEILENRGADSYAWWVAFLKSLDHPTLDQDSSPLSLHHHHHCDHDHHDLVVVGDHGGLLEPSSNPQFSDEWLQLEFPLLVD